MAKSVLVCLSGGVDSTVAALLLARRGYDVSAITFWFWSFLGEAGATTKCCSLDAATQAARELGIPHETLDVSEAFQASVIKDFVTRYRRGETPNPCGLCNRSLRFGLALDYARERGIDFVATGHHVRLAVREAGDYALLRGIDPRKDQTYFLYGLNQRALSRLLFPIGELTKEQVFTVAREHGLSAAALPESQDLCFAADGDVSFLFDPDDFIPGPILDLEGREIGRHNGLPRYTIGQRRGLAISAANPLFVIEIDVERHALIVGQESALYTSSLSAADANYLSGTPPSAEARVQAKVRYRSPTSPATFIPESADRFGIRFDSPQRAITPGQIAAIYDSDQLLGGGIIRAAHATRPQ